MKKPGPGVMGSATEYRPWLRVPPPGRRFRGGSEAKSEKMESDQSNSGDRQGQGIRSMAGEGTKTPSGEDSGAYYGTPAKLAKENCTANPTMETKRRRKDPVEMGKACNYDCIDTDSGNHGEEWRKDPLQLREEWRH